MINRVVLVGRLTKELELRKTTSGISTVNFTLACNRPYQSKDANAPTADFINCVAWRQSAEFLCKYAHKGNIVGVEGSITTRNYEGANGRVYVTEVTADRVQLIGSNRSDNYQNNNTYESKTNYPGNAVTFNKSESSPAVVEENNDNDDFGDTPALDISSDDLPFY